MSTFTRQNKTIQRTVKSAAVDSEKCHVGSKTDTDTERIWEWTIVQGASRESHTVAVIFKARTRALLLKVVFMYLKH